MRLMKKNEEIEENEETKKLKTKKGSKSGSDGPDMFKLTIELSDNEPAPVPPRNEPGRVWREEDQKTKLSSLPAACIRTITRGI